MVVTMQSSRVIFVATSSARGTFSNRKPFTPQRSSARYISSLNISPFVNIIFAAEESAVGVSEDNGEEHIKAYMKWKAVNWHKA